MDADGRTYNSDDFLQEIKSTEHTGRGKLKIFFGYIAGVGKTYTMLKAAHIERDLGKDVVIGYVEPHARPATQELTEGLEALPLLHLNYRGIELSEFDLDAALARHPDIVLVDELAHTNAQGLRHAKRYQDVEELLQNGIDVYTTLNVQHLESLEDVVEDITGITVQERLPDSVFDTADKVEIIDIEPDDLITRLQEGKIYRKNQAERALDNFFTRENLEALREIALRRIANRLNKAKTPKAIKLGKNVEDHILVCLSSSPTNAKVIRSAARIAEAFHGSFTALYVDTPEEKDVSEKDTQTLQDNIRLAEQLGAQVTVLYGYDLANQIMSFAKMSGITKIVLGRANYRRKLPFEKTIFDRLVSTAGNIDIYLVPDAGQKPTRRLTPRLRLMEDITASNFFKMFAIMALVTAVGLFFRQTGVHEVNIICLYILGILFTSIACPGYSYGLGASVLTVLLFNFFFVDPRYSLEFYNPEYLVTFTVVLLASITASTISTRMKIEAQQSSQKAYYAKLLMESTQRMMVAEHQIDILSTAAQEIAHLLNREIVYSLIGDKDKLEFYQIDPSNTVAPCTLSSDERGVAEWVIVNNKHAGATTNTLSRIGYLFLSVRGSGKSLGVVAVPVRRHQSLDVMEKNLMIAILNACGLMIEQRQLRDDRQHVYMEHVQEKWKSNILSAISHDFRTPLTSISGNALMLMEQENHIDTATKHEMYSNIYDDALWLYNLTENLLYITRMNGEHFSLDVSLESLDDIIQEALRHIDRNSKNHTIEVVNEDTYLMVPMESRLIVQVIINLVNNAIKYTPEHSHITISTKRVGNSVAVSVTDDGQGIDPRVREGLFERFRSLGQKNSDGRRGMGLGLNLCKMIVEAHGGTISVSDVEPHGTQFTFTLPTDKKG